MTAGGWRAKSIAMLACFRHIAACPVTVFTGIIAASAGALFGALYAQFALNLDPCVLCLYQRIPFIAAILLGLAGLAFRNNDRAVNAMLGLCSLAFLINSAIALYHSGVERHWWESAVEGCAVPDFSKDPSLLEKILTSPAALCSVIPWKDPVLGLSMANLNVAFCLILFMGCAAVLAVKQCRGHSKTP